MRAAQSAGYLIYSEADFEDFRPAGATRCTDGGEIWGPLLCAKFHPHRCNDKGIGPLKLKFLLIFGQNVEYKRPAGAYPLCDFHKICRICTSFQDASAVKVSLNFLKGLWSYRRFNLTGSDYPQIFQCPLAAKLCVRPPNVLEVKERARGPLSPCQVWWRSDFIRHRGGEKGRFFCMSVTLFLSRL